MILQKYKIVFGGTMGAGKTQAIKALSDIPVLTTEAINTDENAHQKLMTTVGIDYGEIFLDGETRIGLYGTPGQNRFNFMWSIITQGAIGVVILIDHSNVNPLEDLKYYLNAFQPLHQNIVIGVTHLDEKLERPTLIYRQHLKQAGFKHGLFFVDARKHDDILLLVEALIASAEVRGNL